MKTVQLHIKTTEEIKRRLLKAQKKEGFTTLNSYVNYVLRQACKKYEK